MWNVELTIKTNVRHDNIADLLGVKADTFEEENEDLVGEWERHIFGYIEHLIEMKDGVKTRFNYHATEAYAKYLEINCATGYPKIAAGLRTAKETKGVYEVIFRKYLGIQYGESNVFKKIGCC